MFNEEWTQHTDHITHFKVHSTQEMAESARRARKHTNLSSSSLVSDRLIIWTLTAMICIYEVASNHHWSDGRSTSNRKHPAVYNKEPHISDRICATSPPSQVTPNISPTLARRTDNRCSTLYSSWVRQHDYWTWKKTETWEITVQFHLYRRRGLFYLI